MPLGPLLRAASALGASICLAGSAQAESRTGLSMYVNRQMKQVWPWRDDARFEAFTIVTDVTEKLRHTGVYGNEIATVMTDSFEGFPLLVLTDQDGDGEPDFYAYYDENREDSTLEFGAYFTEPGDTVPYWLVFNSGPGLDLSDAGTPKFYWINYQFVDRNRDGRFDTYAVNNLDYDGDGRVAAADVLWLFDEDFDGGLDWGEHIVDGVPHEIPILDGVFQTRRLGENTYERKHRVGDPIGRLADIISADIRKALSEGDRSNTQPPVPYFPTYSFPSRVADLAGWQDFRIGDMRLKLPAGNAWSMKVSEEALQVIGGRVFDDAGALLTADAIIVAKDVMPSPIFGDWVEGELATRHREGEVSHMQSEGTDYSLGAVEMGETVIGPNRFYFLRHFHLYDPPIGNGVRRVRQELHLVFPPDFAETHEVYKLFLMRYCVQDICDNDALDVSYLRQVLGQVSF